MSRGGPPIRRRSSAAQRLEILAFVEGLETEERYLTYWRRIHRDRVLVTIDPFRGGPLQLVEQAIAVKDSEFREAKRGRGRAHDQIWCMFDVDEHPGLTQAVELAERHSIGLAISNPCLELWFMLHFGDHTSHIHRHEAQRRARTLLKCGKVLSESALVTMADHYPDATTRALRLDEKHLRDGSPRGENPSSNAWHLIDQIRGT